MKAVQLLVLILFSSQVFSQEYGARYKLTFISEWSRTSFPIDYPNGAHFSQLVGNTHNSQGGIWSPNELASLGIQDMAETGVINNLTIEINQFISDGKAELLLLGPGIGAVSMTSIEFDITVSHPMVSLGTMIAPSPDWFIGIHNVSLMHSGQWIEGLAIELYPYDSGTDDGLTYNSSNVVTVPPEPIFRITNDPFPNNIPLGHIMFERLSTVGMPPDLIFADGFEVGN